MVSIDYKAIGLRIKIARIQMNYTQEYVAEVCEVSPQHISNIENGKTKLSLVLLIQLANCLNVSVDQLLCDVVDHSEPVFSKEIQDIFDQCSIEDKRFLMQVLKSTQKALTQYKKSFLQNKE